MKKYKIKTEKGIFLVTTEDHGSIYSKGGDYDLQQRLGKFASGPKIAGVPLKERLLSTSVAGLPAGAGGATNIEEGLPAVGQMAGGLAVTGFPGATAIGGVAGATAGEAMRQGIKQARFEKSDISQVPKTAAQTALGEAVFGTLPKIPFVKQFGRELQQKAMKTVGETAKKVMKKAPFIRFSKNDIIQRIDDILTDPEQAYFERGPHKTALMQIKRDLEKMGRPLNFKEMRNIERIMGSKAAYASDATKKTAFRKAEEMAPKANIGLKRERSRVSGKVDEAASRAGFPEFEKQSKWASKLSRWFSEADLERRTGLGRASLATAAAAGLPFYPRSYGEDANPWMAASGIPLLISPRMRTAFFKNVMNTPAGKTLARAMVASLTGASRKDVEM